MFGRTSRQGSSSRSLFTSRTCRWFPRLAGSDPTGSSDAICQALSHYSDLRLHTKTLISRERALERGPSTFMVTRSVESGALRPIDRRRQPGEVSGSLTSQRKDGVESVPILKNSQRLDQ